MTIFTRDNLPFVFAAEKELVEKDRKLSPIRAGEIAAGRINAAIRARLRKLEDRIQDQQAISDDEIAWYDSIFVDGWNYAAQLIELSGSRTLLLDTEDAESAMASA